MVIESSSQPRPLQALLQPSLNAMQGMLRGSPLACSTSGRPAAAPVVIPSRRHASRHRMRVAKPDVGSTQLAEDHQIDTTDAFAELVRMAVAKDPSLAPLAQQHLNKQVAEPRSPFANPAPASAMLGPSLGALPNSSKPPWLRQRAPQVCVCSCACHPLSPHGLVHATLHHYMHTSACACMNLHAHTAYWGLQSCTLHVQLRAGGDAAAPCM